MQDTMERKHTHNSTQRLHRLTMSELRSLYAHYFGFELRTQAYAMDRHELVRVLAPELDMERYQ